MNIFDVGHILYKKCLQNNKATYLQIFKVVYNGIKERDISLIA